MQIVVGLAACILASLATLKLVLRQKGSQYVTLSLSTLLFPSSMPKYGDRRGWSSSIIVLKSREPRTKSRPSPLPKLGTKQKVRNIEFSSSSLSSPKVGK